MRNSTRRALRSLIVVALALAVGCLASWPMRSASGQTAQLTIMGGPSSITVQVQGVTNLGAYEWQLSFDPNVVAFVSATNGDFLGSTGRSVACPPPIVPPSQGLEPGNVRFGCATVGSQPAGPAGDGLLSTVTFEPVGGGAPNIQFVCAGLSDPFGEDIPISNVPPCVSAVTPTPGPGETPAPTDTPGPGETPAATTGPMPTATPAATTGPLPTPTPLPPGLEAVALALGCNPAASTYPDDTPIQTLADAVGPTGILEALWAFEMGTWRGYSPQFPEVSNLAHQGFLEVVFVCVNAPGDFVRRVV